MLMRKTIVAVAILLAMLGSSWGRSRSHHASTQQTQSAQQPAATDQRGSEQSPAFIKIIPIPKTNAEAAQEAADRKQKADSDRSLIGWTAAVAAFTLVLAAVGAWQGIQLKRSVDLARSEFASVHRPKLIVRQFVLARPTPDQVLDVEFSIINIGDTEATWRYWHSEVALWNGKYWEEPGLDHIVKPISMPPIKNGQRVGVTVQSRFRITPAQIAAVEENKLIICAVGELTYADALGTQRRTSFRRNYNCSTDMFDASPHNDHEYQD
jgi:hypothetical protein